MKRKGPQKAQRGHKKQKNALQTQVHSPQSILYPQNSLLGLPVELRLQILQYLLPDVAIVPFRKEIFRHRVHPTSILNGYRYTSDSDEDEDEDTSLKEFKSYQASVNQGFRWSDTLRDGVLRGYRPLRINLESCSPSIMRVNHQLYRESLPLVYKRKTFAAHIFKEAMILCSHPFSYHNDDRSLCELSLHVGRIESMELVITHEIGLHQHEIDNTIMLSASLANALSERQSLRRLSIVLEVYPCDSEYDTAWVGEIYEKDLTRLLKCFELLRNLESVAIHIKGCRETGLDGANREEWAYQFSSRFSRFLRKLPNTMQSRTRMEPKKVEVDLFRRYLEGHKNLFSMQRGVFGSASPESGRDLLRDAWEACACSDMIAYDKVLKVTKTRWRAMERLRRERMMDEFDQQASVVRL
ncbi:Mitogen-activated protein kinase [Venturia nashicola]|uniref:Mitogen-activated protein kinase n=1 Tax=Venturia nashicola TaxID=86259 RepID=A0A4Z1NXL0_9PEZI|nr:Mitogen-activated protein kinase [Venturia nashicola]TLD18280.1 Mitogen-activated protein kinase [Venturia nashicola]